MIRAAPLANQPAVSASPAHSIRSVIPTMLAMLAALALTALLPAGLAAQGVSVTPFAAANGGLPGASGFVGLSATRWTGAVGIRVGGAIDAPSSPLAPLLRRSPSDGVEAWQGEVDLVFDLGRAGVRIRNTEPRVFAGLGVQGRRQAEGGASTIPVWSYGLGTAIPLTRWLALDLEARYRMPHETDPTALPAGVGAGWEARSGLAFRLGGGRATAHRPAPATRPAPARSAPPRTGPGAIPLGAASAPAREASAAAIAHNALSAADRYVGIRYVWGGNTPSEGFDCSGFVRYIFAQHGIQLPRVSRDQAGAGQWLPPRLDALAPGDLMFYAGRDGVIDHVAIYAGDGRIIHASATGRGVRYDDLTSSRGHYYATRMVAARRVIPDGGVFGR
jgi:cell wall-associated NlpC family hydrolase